ncbi:mambaquaretin-4 [Anabrus simplex]|uniref:mambaquaretin-4 n=1 Tax=Anabrus simplex TaxID=316456 RepID=UPI0035A300DC
MNTCTALTFVVLLAGALAVPVTDEKRDCSVDFYYSSTEYCPGIHITYTYINRDNKCIQFIYGGCHGHGNRFKTQEDCERTCVKQNI